MSTITRERLEQLANFRGAPVTRQEEQELARIALASLEAEAVALRDERSGSGGISKKPGFNDLPHGTPLYAAPPAPECLTRPVHPRISSEELDDETLDELIDFRRSTFEYHSQQGNKVQTIIHGVTLTAMIELKERRAAMLQGAEPVMTAYKLPFEQWLSQQTGTIDVECGCVMTEVFFHWLRVAYEAGNSPVIPDGYCIMPLKLTADNGAKGALCGEFHVQYRIVCQSCVGEGCEDCNHTGGWDAEIPVSWDTIKRIHESAVEACALPAAPQQEDK
ncbi:TPA: hypothetical protein ACX3M3_000704 [Enterobacter hormaechei]